MWSGRSYPTKGEPLVAACDGEPGVALPLRRPPWWLAALFGLLALVVGGLVISSIVRLAQGDTEDGVVVTVVALLGGCLIAALFALGVRRVAQRRRDPGRVLVTPTRLITPRIVADWDSIDAVRAHQEHRQGHVRAIDIVVIDVAGVTGTLFEAAELDTDPRRAVDSLRRLHAEPALRSRLATPEGITLFTPADRISS